MSLDADRRVRFGRLLGLLFIAGGFVVIGVAWNGAASINLRVDSQFPYLLSGGFAGLGLIVTGSVLLLLSIVRAERMALSSKFDEMTQLLSRNLARQQFSTNGHSETEVVAGVSVYHRPDCKVLEGKGGLDLIPLEQAAAQGLTPCRVCNPPVVKELTEELTPAATEPSKN
jgi:hypothetical protein